MSISVETEDPRPAYARNKISDFGAITSVSNDITLDRNDEIIYCAGTFTVNLPPVASFIKKRYYIKNVGTGLITVDGNLSERIDNELKQTLTRYDCMYCQSDGSGWNIL